MNYVIFINVIEIAQEENRRTVICRRERERDRRDRRARKPSAVVVAVAATTIVDVISVSFKLLNKYLFIQAIKQKGILKTNL